MRLYFASMLKIYISISIRFVHPLFTGLYVILTDDHRGSLWVKSPLSFSHDSMRHSGYIPDVSSSSSQLEWFARVWVCVCMFAWAKEWVIVWNERVCVSSLEKKKKKNLHSDLIWSDRNLALLWSEMIGKSLASLHGVEQPASQQTGASTLYVVVRGDELIRYTSSMWVWVDLKSHGGHWV